MLLIGWPLLGGVAPQYLPIMYEEADGPSWICRKSKAQLGCGSMLNCGKVILRICNIENTLGRLYNTVRYTTVLDITLIIDGPLLDYFCYMSVHFIFIITRIGYLTWKLPWAPAIVL